MIGARASDRGQSECFRDTAARRTVRATQKDAYRVDRAGRGTKAPRSAASEAADLGDERAQARAATGGGAQTHINARGRVRAFT